MGLEGGVSKFGEWGGGGRKVGTRQIVICVLQLGVKIFHVLTFVYS